MHEEDNWPRRGGGRRGGWHAEPHEHGERHQHDPWEFSRRGRGGPGPWGPGGRRAFAKRVWTGDEPPRRPRVKRGDVRAAALALLAEEPRNGYQIIQEIAERSGGVWQPSPGSVYPALQQLEDEGLIRAESMDSGRKGFSLTEAGRAYVAEHGDEVAEPWAVVAGREHGGVREMRELIGQLAMAAMQVTSAGSDAQVAEAQRILSATRRSLYRILATEEDETAATEAGDTAGEN
ncbi:MAG TPA: PadR family transcriptional regulator [Streptosporangiaceae bacterium]|jgi:DNA-binding PadR family transcriptional regulator|nr:PadR family transcriptional regulator [Streptosporangiaceae bacterium]